MDHRTPADVAARPPFERQSSNTAAPHGDGGGSPGRVAKAPGGTAQGAPRKPREDESGGRDFPGRGPVGRGATPERALWGREGGLAPSPVGGGEGEGSEAMDVSFPDDGEDVEIGSFEEEEEEYDDEGDGAEETEEDRQMAESEALARQLMAEEAVASYALGAEYLRAHADQFSGADLAALEAALAEEDPEPAEDDLPSDDDDDDVIDDSRELSYDALLLLGERIGDVKAERWARVAADAIARHCGPASEFAFAPAMAVGKAENHTEVKCQVCQFPYAPGEALRRLPCGHCFHRECIDAWLGTKDACALCRRSIVPADD